MANAKTLAEIVWGKKLDTSPRPPAGMARALSELMNRVSKTGKEEKPSTPQ